MCEDYRDTRDSPCDRESSDPVGSYPIEDSYESILSQHLTYKPYDK